MAHWIDNADSYICPICGFETDNPNRHFGTCPKCFFSDTKDHNVEDFVKVVRCKDCAWYAPNNDGSWIGCAFDTRHPEDFPNPYDYCSQGERKGSDAK